jgi:predicted acetyltransferase
MQYYLHDFSEFDPGLRSDEAGRFAYPYLDFYWRDPDRYPFLIRYAGQLAGFALVRQESDPDSGLRITEMAEFFVLRPLRRLGVGKLAACQLWEQFPGHWRVEVVARNSAGHRFWQAVVSEHTGGHFSETTHGSGVRELTFVTPVSL